MAKALLAYILPLMISAATMSMRIQASAGRSARKRGELTLFGDGIRDCCKAHIEHKSAGYKISRIGHRWERTLRVTCNVEGNNTEINNADVPCVVHLQMRWDRMSDKRASRMRGKMCLEVRIHDTALL